MYVKSELPILPLGDRFDYFLYCHILSEDGFDICMDRIKDFDTFRNVMSSDVKIGTDSTEHFYNTANFKKYYRTLTEFPKADNITNYNVELPKKFVVSQWDAQQDYRKIDTDRRKNIEKFYKDQGYEFVIVGGEAEGDYKTSLDFIFYVMSKAELYVGADSGMMHLSKVIFDADKIHPYVNFKWERNDHKKNWQKHADKRSLTQQVRMLEEKGTILNYCEGGK